MADRHAHEEAQRAEEYEAHVANLRRALETRDVIGQAKGVLMVAMRCSADHANATLVRQSHDANRKLVEIAAEIVNHVESRAVQT